MPRKPAPIVVEVVYESDPDRAHEARINALSLIADYILEDRAEVAEVAKIETRSTLRVVQV